MTMWPARPAQRTDAQYRKDEADREFHTRLLSPRDLEDAEHEAECLRIEERRLRYGDDDSAVAWHDRAYGRRPKPKTKGGK